VAKMRTAKYLSCPCYRPLRAERQKKVGFRLPAWFAQKALPAHGAAAPSKKPRFGGEAGLFGGKSLTMTYFRTGCSTIIGAKSFHGPVRDGKGWDRLAMVIRHDG
jgi:hypothetical protein